MKRFGWIWSFLLGLGLVGGIAAPGSGESPTGASLVQLRDVSVERRDEGLAVQLKTSGPAHYRTALIDTPTRLVIDLESTDYGWRKQPLTVNSDPLREIRGSQFSKGVARVVLELSRTVGYWVEEGSGGLTVMLQRSPASKAPVTAERTPQPEEPAVPVKAERHAADTGKSEAQTVAAVVQAPGRAADSNGSPTDASLVQLRDVSVERRDEGLAVRIKTNGPAQYQTALIDTPTRLVIDLESAGYGWRKQPLTVNSDPLREIRGSQFSKGVARVVLELSRTVGYRVQEGPEGLTVMLESSAPRGVKADGKPIEVAAAATPGQEAGPGRAAVPTAPEPQSIAKTVPEPLQMARMHEAPNVEVAKKPTSKRETPRQPSVAVPPPTLSPLTPAPVRLAQVSKGQQASSNGPRLISLDFKDADINNILRILAAESGRNIVAGEDVRGKVTMSLHNVSWELALDTILEAKGLQRVERDNVLRIVSSEQLAKERELKAKAEEAKLKSEAEIRTKIAEAELKEAEARQRKLQAEAAIAEAKARGPLKEATIRLKYADPEEVVATLLGILGIPEGGVPAVAPALAEPGVTPSIGLGGPPPIAEPPFSQLYGPPGGAAPAAGPAVSASAEVLSKGITIRAHKATNTIFIRHYERDLERIKKLIQETLDVPLPQVKIEARMEILDRPSLFEIGVQWGGAGVKRADDHNILLARGNQPAGFPAGIPPNPRSVLTPGKGVNPGLTLGNFLPVDAGTGLATGGNLVNLPVTGGALTRAPAGGITFGIVGTRFNLNLALTALERLEKAKSLARPELVTVENKPAQISLGEEIPYQTVSSAGTQVQFKEAVLKLEVTPTVIYEEGGIIKIKMKVLVENNERGTVLAGVPAIDKRRAETEVIVKEGEVLVIGGVSQRTSTETITKVPLFGDIPVIGWLFKRKAKEVFPDTEMVIFITPSVIKGSVPYPGIKKPLRKGS